MSKKRVLVVDDDDGIRMICKMSMEHFAGWDVLALSSGAEAVEQAAAFAPDLLVLDVSMPGMDGPETLSRLREQAPLQSVPVAFLTAHVQPDYIAQLRAKGATVLAKPFDPVELVTALKGLMP